LATLKDLVRSSDNR